MSLFDKFFKKNVESTVNTSFILNSKLKKEYNKIREKSTHSTFCKAPLTNLYFSWEGIALACCYNQTYVLGKYPEQTIHEIWTGAKANELRNKLSNYDLSKGCMGCMKDIEISRYSSANALRFDALPIGSFPSMMEFQLTNTCNLECVMCDGFLSSAIRANREKLPAIPEKFDEAFVQQLETFIPHLKYTTFSGGEPFLIKTYYQIWDRMAELNPDCQVNVITNGTIFTKRVEEVILRNKFNITISIDSPHKETYESIRKGASFDKVLENAKKFNDYCKKTGTNFNFNFCPMKSNWKELPEFIQFANNMEASFYLSVVYHPVQYSLSSLATEELQQIINHLSAVLLPENTTLQKRNKNEFKAFIQLLTGFALKNFNQPAVQQIGFDEVLLYILNKITQYENENPSFSGDHLRTKINELIGSLPNTLLNYDEIMPALENMSIESLENHLNDNTENLRKLITQKFNID